MSKSKLRSVETRGHKLQDRKAAQPVAVTRIMGSLRVAIRERVLRANPLCVICEREGRTTLATEVDHIVPLWEGGIEDRWSDSNRQGLCRDCHARKTAAEAMRRYSRQ